MKIAIAQLNYHIGNFETNERKIVAAIDEAVAKGAELVLFSELAVCGYPARDFLEFDDFIEKSDQLIQSLLPKSKQIGIVIGTPVKNPKIEGKDLFNAALFLYEGEIKASIYKTLLPTYDVFDEYRYFEPNNTFQIVKFKGKRLAVTICEDIWNISNENPLYPICPMDELMKQSPDIMLNLSASPFSYTHAESRLNILKENAKRYQLPIFYANQLGGQTELIFDGGSMVMNAKAELHARLPFFNPAIEVFDTESLETASIAEFEKYELIEEALVLGLHDYFQKLGFKKAILGLSGGIDSALTVYLASRALGSENVLSVLMSSEFSSDHSINDSIALCDNLGSPYHNISIQPIYTELRESLASYFEGTTFGIAEENMQSRSRALVLMSFANKFGRVLLNTSNKSEAAVGYGTIYGDMCGGVSVIGDLYKTEVFELCRHINRNKEMIPSNIITKPPSAELRPNQKDSDSLPAYGILDSILFQYIEERQGPSDIKAAGYDPALVDRVLKLVNQNEWKRYQTPPMLRISSKAFGMGRRMPIVGKYLS